MTEHPEPMASSPRPSARCTGAGAALVAMAPNVQRALIGLGLLSAVGELGTNDSTVVLAARGLARLGGFVLAGWVARRLLGALGALLELYAAVERPGGLVSPPAPTPAPTMPPSAPAPGSEAGLSDARTLAHAEIRLAIRQGQWSQAEALLETFTEVHAGLATDDPFVGRLRDELAAAKQAAIAGLRARLDAAREASDCDRTLEFRETLAPLLIPDDLRTLDRDLARWFMGLIQKRLRQGTLSGDVVLLTSRVAEAFATTPEGASLRAALPTLRRSVGLCARCGRPYTGIADACPSCLASSSLPAQGAPATPTPPDDHDDLDALQSSEAAPTEEMDLEPE
jgi:hypothetical protein